MLSLAKLKAAGQASPAAIVIATGLGVYVFAWSSAQLVKYEIDAWNRHAAPIERPIEEPPPIVRETPKPAPSVDVSAHNGKHHERIGDQFPTAPAPSPTLIAKPRSPDFVVTLPPDIPLGPPIVEAGPGRFAHPIPPPHPRPWHSHLPAYRLLPDSDFERELPHTLVQRPLFGGERGFIGLGRRDGLPPHIGDGFRGGGFPPFLPRPMQGGIFRPRLPFGGFGHRFF